MKKKKEKDYGNNSNGEKKFTPIWTRYAKTHGKITFNTHQNEYSDARENFPKLKCAAIN